MQVTHTQHHTPGTRTVINIESKKILKTTSIQDYFSVRRMEEAESAPKEPRMGDSAGSTREQEVQRIGNEQPVQGSPKKSNEAILCDSSQVNLSSQPEEEPKQIEEAKEQEREQERDIMPDPQVVKVCNVLLH